jgi:hypothetical protein
MVRPRKAVRPVEKSISLPLDLVTRVDLMLWSELEERVPHGAWAAYVQTLVEGDLKRKELAAQGAVHG